MGADKIQNGDNMRVERSQLKHFAQSYKNKLQKHRLLVLLVFTMALRGCFELMKQPFYIRCKAIRNTRRKFGVFVGKKVNADIFGGSVIGVCSYPVASGRVKNSVAGCYFSHFAVNEITQRAG